MTHHNDPSTCPARANCYGCSECCSDDKLWCWVHPDTPPPTPETIAMAEQFRADAAKSFGDFRQSLFEELIRASR